ncbi:MAG: hypothetical protein ABR548_05535 [Actinomycetota bacterium]
MTAVLKPPSIALAEAWGSPTLTHGPDGVIETVLSINVHVRYIPPSDYHGSWTIQIFRDDVGEGLIAMAEKLSPDDALSAVLEFVLPVSPTPGAQDLNT